MTMTITRTKKNKKKEQEDDENGEEVACVLPTMDSSFSFSFSLFIFPSVSFAVSVTDLIFDLHMAHTGVNLLLSVCVVLLFGIMELFPQLLVLDVGIVGEGLIKPQQYKQHNKAQSQTNHNREQQQQISHRRAVLPR